MSITKSPQEKKRLSLERDRRNSYRENDKASRKLIPRRKQLSHMKLRRESSQILASLRGSVNVEACDSAELDTKIKSTIARRKSFRKKPDISLGEVLKKAGKR
jgi:hypothetical protein